jgi:hypothetical protein
MLSKTYLLVHIALVPLYISLAFYLNLIPSTVSDNLSSLLRLAKANLQSQYLKATTISTSTMTSMNFVARKSQDRGNADHGWLKTFHTFSFATYASFICPSLFFSLIEPSSRYQNGQHQLFGPLRVINEDRVASSNGFGTHSHREFEIFSYVVAGELEQFVSFFSAPLISRLTSFFIL